jgi:ABC-type branched-subunit amino acid transport system ATPase component
MSVVDPQLVLSTVQSGYGRVKVVNNVSLEVATGEIVAVIGRNGVGKTTLMKTIIGEIPLMAGMIRFRGVDINGFDKTLTTRRWLRSAGARRICADDGGGKPRTRSPRWRSEQGEL